MRRTLLVMASVAMLMASASLYGCGMASLPPEEAEKVVVNEGLDKEQEEELSQRLEELESKVEAQEEAGQPEPQPEESAPEGHKEADLVTAVEDYYEAVHSEDWGYTYDNLDSQTRALFDEDEWYQKNQWYADTEGLGTPSIDVQVNDPTSDPVVGVTVYRAFDDGTSINRDTVFVWGGDAWKHRFVGEELTLYMPEASYEEFVAEQGGSEGVASTSSSASASASASADQQSAGTKHVEVVVTSDVPADVSISDDNFEVAISEEITGSKTYEFDIAVDSGLLVSAMNPNLTGNVSITVYENGTQKTQDSDSTGYAQISY